MMTTRSIFAALVIDTPEAAEQLLMAMEQSAADESMTVSVPYVEVHGDVIREMFNEQ